MQYVDFITVVKDGLTSDIFRASSEVKKQEYALERLVKNKERATGLITFVFEHSIRQLSIQLASVEQSKEIMEAALEMISDSSYEFDVAPQVQSGGYTTTSYTTA